MNPSPAPARDVNDEVMRQQRRILADRLARMFVGSGGVIVIGAILAILFVIVVEALPLFYSAKAGRDSKVALDATAHPLLITSDTYREVAMTAGADGLRFFSLDDGKLLETELPPEVTAAGAFIAASLLADSEGLAVASADGSVFLLKLDFELHFEGDQRSIVPALELESTVKLAPEEDGSIRHLVHADIEGGAILAAAFGGKKIQIIRLTEKSSLFGESTWEENREEIELSTEGNVSALAMDSEGEKLYAGTSTGELVRIDLSEDEPVEVAEQRNVATRLGVPVTALSLLLGGRTLIVGDGAGAVSSWQIISIGEMSGRLTRIHTFTGHGQPVIEIAPSRRNKGFLTADASGLVRLHYATTGKTLLTKTLDIKDATALSFSPRGDGFLLASAEGGIENWWLRNEHPEISLRTLFGEVQYESYPGPEMVWQSTGGTDDFEPKFSLTPLLFGTIKGTFYALLFALPLALLAALYVSQFMHPTLRGYIKPLVEIMAALPSVILGFLAGLWLAPIVKNTAPGILLSLVALPVTILAALLSWQRLPAEFRRKLKPGTEVMLLIPVVAATIWACIAMGGWAESLFFSGDYRHWLFEKWDIVYDPRNSLIVGIAMGIAVIPIIFTIAEDALSSVPPHLTAGSLALGATRWQTAVRVVLPTASPGIFSAVMIGLGRAIGETMIVLMATGNTPIINFSPFNGFRALSANIAVELPEAPADGTLYRIIFLAALLLFVMTFIVNTAAEIVRLRLRKKYQAHA